MACKASASGGTLQLRVLDPSGDPVPRRIDLGNGESLWRFTPAAPWPDARHQLVTAARLEDLAGNRPDGPFDRPIGTPETAWAHMIDWSPATVIR